MRKEVIKRANKILELYEQGHIPADLEQEVRDWLDSEATDEGKVVALRRLFEKRVHPIGKPGKRAYEMYYKTAARLGFTAIRKGKKTLWPRIMFRVAVVFVAALLIAGVGRQVYDRIFDPEESSSSQWIVSVPAGEQKEINLADGSWIVASEGSKVVVSDDFEENRKVQLQGKAHFSVEKTEDKKPFIIASEHVIITVLGTDFLVDDREKSEKTTVTLYSGILEVGNGGENHRMRRGQELQINRTTGKTEVKNLSADDMLRAGYPPYLNMENVSLTDILKAVEANYGVEFQIDIAIPADAGYRIDVEGEPLEQVLCILRRMTPQYDYKRENSKIIISKSKN